jgi:hypothetical protein
VRNAAAPLSATGARATLESAAARVEAPREGAARRETRARAETETVAMELMVRGVLCGGQCRPEGSRRHRVGHAETRENCTKTRKYARPLDFAPFGTRASEACL